MRGKGKTFVVVAMLVFGGLMVSYLSFNQSAKADFLWDIQQADNSINDVGSYTSMALDENGFPHISYIDKTDGMLRHANWTGTRWNIESITYASGSTSIELDNNSYPHIVYYDASLGLLMYAWWNKTFWDFQIIDNTQMITGYISMKLNNTNEPHVSGCDYVNENLMYWNRTGTTWNSYLVDPDACDFGYTSLYLDNKEYPHISYINFTSHHLKYAKWTGTSWSIEIVDDTHGPGRYNSIVLDTTDKPFISYYDDTNKDLRYAKRNPLFGWEVEVVDSDGDVGTYTSIALDSSNHPYISYYDETNKSLKLAEWTGSEWDIDIVDSSGSVGMYTSIALNNSYYPHISYYDEANGNLKYARGFPPTPPSAPNNLQAVGDDSEVLLTWNAPSSNGGTAITNYTIYRGLSSGGETFLAITGNVLSYLDASVSNGQAYYYKVTAINGIGEGPQSNEASATPATIPSAPQNVQVYNGDSCVNITWNPPSDGGSTITGYRIYRNYSAVPSASLPASRFWYNDTSAINGVTYNYNISAMNSVGEGPNSTISGMPIAAPSEPIILFVNASDSKVTISWGAPISDGGSSIAHYNIYRGTFQGELTFLVELDNETFTYVDTGLTNGVTYYYRMNAWNAAGEGANTAEMSARPMTEPSEPAGLVVTPGNSNITLAWSPPASDGGSPITHYRIYRGNSPGDLLLLTELDNDTLTFTDTGLTNGATYYYKVTAVNAAGEGIGTYETSSTPAGKGFLEEFWWVLLVISLLAIVVLVVIFFMRRRRSEDEAEQRLEAPPPPPTQVQEGPPARIEEGLSSVAVVKIKEIPTERPRGKMPSSETVRAGEAIEAQAKAPAIPRKVVKKPIQKVYQKRKVVKEPGESELNEEKEKKD